MSVSTQVTDVKAILFDQGITLWRHKWTVVTVCWAVCLLGWSAVMLMPRQYESNTRAFVDVNGLLTPLLKGLVIDTNAAQTGDYLRQTLLSRPNLEEVIQLAELNPGNGVGQKDALVNALSNNVRVTAQGRNLIGIAYANRDPVVAKNVVQSLLTIFAEKAASSSRVEMEKARKFLEDQIAVYENQLRDAEQRRADFRKKYSEFLADSVSGIPRLENLQQQVTAARQQYETTIVTRDALIAQMATIPQFMNVETAPTVSANGALISASPALRLAEARRNLAELRLRFTDRHPDVIAAKRMVDELQSQASAAPQADLASAAEGGMRVPNPTYEQMRLKLVDAQTAVPAAKRRLDQAMEEFNRVKGLGAEIPDVDAKAKDLDRDYDVIKKNHDELIQRRESATLSQAADDQADRTQFRIVDPPQVPLLPSSPNLPVMFSIVLVFALGVGLGLPIVLTQFRGTFSSETRLRDLGLPVIGCVTYVQGPSSRGQFLASSAALASAAGVLVVYGALMFFAIGTYRGFL